MKTKLILLAMVTIFITATAFKSTRDANYKYRSELEQLYAKAKADHKELAQFEEEYLNFKAKVDADRISISQKISARERLHAQAKALVNSIRNETIKKHVSTIQASYYEQFSRLKKEQLGMMKPMDQELAVSQDWLNAMKIAYSLEQNRIIEHEIEKELRASGISLDKVKELNADGKRLVTKMLTPAD